VQSTPHVVIHSGHSDPEVAGSAGEDDLSGGVAVEHRTQCVVRLVHRKLQADVRVDGGALAECEKIG
jgi:hypothetical protein